MTREQDFKDLMVESDCSLVVKEISQKDESLCEWGSLIKDIQDMSIDFNSCSFNHINRCANVIAHNLAQIECAIGEQMVWRNSLPPSLCNQFI